MRNDYCRKLVYIIYRLFSDKIYAYNTFIRAMFIRTMFAQSFPVGVDNVIESFNELKLYLLDNLKDEFFNNIHKKEFCNFISNADNSLLTEENKRLKIELWQSFSCN